MRSKEEMKNRLFAFVKHFPDIDKFVSEFWECHEHKMKEFWTSKKTHKNDIIISACLDVVLEEICRRLNIKNFVGSKTDLETMKLVDFCFRENKVKVFKEKFPDAEIDNFYTDSLNDQPMIDLARNAYLVKGDKLIKIK